MVIAAYVLIFLHVSTASTTIQPTYYADAASCDLAAKTIIRNIDMTGRIALCLPTKGQ